MTSRVRVPSCGTPWSPPGARTHPAMVLGPTIVRDLTLLHGQMLVQGAPTGEIFSGSLWQTGRGLDEAFTCGIAKHPFCEHYSQRVIWHYYCVKSRRYTGKSGRYDDQDRRRCSARGTRSLPVRALTWSYCGVQVASAPEPVADSAARSPSASRAARS